MKNSVYSGMNWRKENPKVELLDISKLPPLIIAHVEVNNHGLYLQESVVQLIRCLKKLSRPAQHGGAAAGHRAPLRSLNFSPCWAK